MSSSVVQSEDYHPRIRKIIQYWRSIHPEAGLPGRQHLDPVDFPELLPHVRLVDVIGPEPRFFVRLCGERIREHFGVSHQGKFFDELFPTFEEQRSYGEFMRVLETGETIWCKGHCELSPDKDFVPMERVILPLAGDGHSIDTLLVVSLFGEAARRFDEVGEPLDVGGFAAA